MTEQMDSRVGWFFAIMWIVASKVAVFIVGFIMLATVSLLGPIVGLLAAYALMGAIFGTAQSWAMPDFRGQEGRWVLLTMIGLAGAVSIGMLLRMNQVMLFTFIGAASGFLQWTMLHHKVRRAGLWIVANAVAWLLSALWEDTGLLLIGPITGLTMMWLLNHPKQSLATATTQVN